MPGCNAIKLRRILLLGLSMLWLAPAAGEGRVPLPVLPEANSRVSEAQGCVEPTEVMRRYHMTLILHQRDKTMHQGIRTKDHSLAECVACHVSRDEAGNPIPINAPGQFCQSCHAFAAVSIDCFQCHATVPRAEPDILAGGAGHGDAAAEGELASEEKRDE